MISSLLTRSTSTWAASPVATSSGSAKSTNSTRLISFLASSVTFGGAFATSDHLKQHQEDFRRLHLLELER
ncbi:hypothetical protein H9P43_005141, partial [Blastocladiella emersonii ATCC 22665]